MSEYSKNKLQQQKYEDCLKSQTLEEMTDKYLHIKRVAEGSSKLQLSENANDEVFADVYPEFQQTFSRGQLQYLEKTFLAADLDHDCKLNKVELMRWMEQQGCPINQVELRDIFSEADADRDGYLSFQEFVSLCQNSQNPELKNVPSQSKFVASQTIQPDLDSCICSTSRNNNFNNARDEDCSRHFGREAASYNNGNGLNKFSNAIKPGLMESGRSNIQQSVKYFECEISKENRKKDNDIQIGQYLTEGKLRAKSNQHSMKHNDYENNMSYYPDEVEMPSPYYPSEFDRNTPQQRQIHHSNQPNYVNPNFQLPDRLLKVTRRFNPSQYQEDDDHSVLRVRDHIDNHHARFSEADHLNGPRNYLGNAFQDIEQQNEMPRNYSKQQSLESAKRNLPHVENRFSQEMNETDYRKFSNSSNQANNNNLRSSTVAPSEGRRSSAYQENTQLLQNMEGRRGSLPAPNNKYSLTEHLNESNRRNSEPYEHTGLRLSSVQTPLDSQKKHSSASQDGEVRRISAENQPNHEERHSLPNPENSERRNSHLQGNNTFHRSSLPNPQSVPKDYESPRRSTFPSSNGSTNKNSLPRNQAFNNEDNDLIKNYPESPRLSKPSPQSMPFDTDENPIIPEYLFNDEQNGRMNRSSRNSTGSGRNSYPKETVRTTSYEQEKRYSNPSSVNGEPIIPEYLFQDQNGQLNAAGQNSSGSGRNSYPMPSTRNASYTQEKRQSSNPTSVTGEPIIPEYLFQDQNGQLNAAGQNSSGSGRNSYPMSSNRNASYTQEKRQSNPTSVNGEPIIPEYLFQEQNVRPNVQESSGNGRNSYPLSNGRKTSYDPERRHTNYEQERRYSNPPSVNDNANVQRRSRDNQFQVNLKPMEDRTIRSNAFNEARETFNVDAPPPIPDDEWLSGVSKVRIGPQDANQRGSGSRRRSTLEEIDKEARRSSILGSVAAQRGSLVPKDEQAVSNAERKSSK